MTCGSREGQSSPPFASTTASTTTTPTSTTPAAATTTFTITATTTTIATTEDLISGKMYHWWQLLWGKCQATQKSNQVVKSDFPVQGAEVV